MKRILTATALLGLSIPTFAADFTGYIVDQKCAGNRGMWQNEDCVSRCIRDGSPPVLATEDDKVYKIANDEKVPDETYGNKVTITGKLDGDTITIEKIKKVD